MFSLLGNCYSLRKNKETRNVTLIILGFDNAGKTTTVRDLQQESKTDVTPSLGFSNVSLKIGRINITLFDVGGGPTIRDIWSSYYADVHGFVYVVDSTDLSRLQDVCANLRSVLSEPMLKGKPCLILANKQDKDGALSESSLAQILDLENLAKTSSSMCRLELCSALQDPGTSSGNKQQKKGIAGSVGSYSSGAVKEGFRWLVDNILSNWEPLNDRVVRDVQIQKEQDQKARKAKAERIRKIKEEREKKEKQNNKFSGGLEKPSKQEDSDNGQDVKSRDKLNGEVKEIVNSGSGDERVSESYHRIVEFAGLMHELGPDLNKSFSESLKSNRSVNRTKISAKNREKENAFEMSLEEGNNLVKDRLKSSASISPRSGHVSSDVDTMDELPPEGNSNGTLGVHNSTETKCAKSSTASEDKMNTPKDHRLLPPLIDSSKNDHSSGNLANSTSKDSKKKRRKKYKKNQLAPMDVKTTTSPNLVSLPSGGTLSVDSGMVPDEESRPRVCSPRNTNTNLVLVYPSTNNMSEKIPVHVAKRKAKDVNLTNYGNDHKWTKEESQFDQQDLKSFQEGSDQTQNELQSEVREWRETSVENENEILPIELQAYHLDGVSCDDLVSNSST